MNKSKVRQMTLMNAKISANLDMNTRSKIQFYLSLITGETNSADIFLIKINVKYTLLNQSYSTRQVLIFYEAQYSLACSEGFPSAEASEDFCLNLGPLMSRLLARGPRPCTDVDTVVGAELFLVGLDVFSFVDGVFVEGGLTLDPSCCCGAAVFEAAALEVEALEAGGSGAR